MEQLTALEVWTLCRVLAGYQITTKKDIRHNVLELARYLGSLAWKDREYTLRIQLDEKEFERVVGADSESPEPGTLADVNERNWTIIHASKLKDLPPLRWLVPGEIPEGGLVVLFGQSGAGKSFLSLDYALRLAQENPVVYIAAEGESGYTQRVEAWCRHHRQGVGNLYMCLGAVNMYEPHDYQAFVEQIAVLKPCLVIVDTLAMCMIGGDENSSRDMGMVVKACRQIQRTLACAVMIVHHVNKGGVAERGSGALRGAADAMIKVSPTDDVIVVESNKTKDVAPFPTRYIRLLPVPVGLGEDGKMIESVVVIPSDRVIQTKQDPLSNNQRKVLEALAMEIYSGGASLSDVAEVTEIGRGQVQKIMSRLMEFSFAKKEHQGYVITNEGRHAVGDSSAVEVTPVTGQLAPSLTPVTPVTPVTPSGNHTSSEKHMESVESLESLESVNLKVKQLTLLSAPHKSQSQSQYDFE